MNILSRTVEFFRLHLLAEKSCYKFSKGYSTFAVAYNAAHVHGGTRVLNLVDLYSCTGVLNLVVEVVSTAVQCRSTVELTGTKLAHQAHAADARGIS